MEEKDYKKPTGVYSKVIRAGRRRTYFFDVRSTKNEEFFLTITESKKKFDSESYERHKVHVYKEDFHKFINAIEDVVGHIKELMPNYDYDEFTRPVQTIEYDEDGNAIREEYETESNDEFKTEGNDETKIKDNEEFETEDTTSENEDINVTQDKKDQDLSWD